MGKVDDHCFKRSKKVLLECMEETKEKENLEFRINCNYAYLKGIIKTCSEMGESMSLQQIYDLMGLASGVGYDEK